MIDWATWTAFLTAVGGAISAVGNIYSTRSGKDQTRKVIEALTDQSSAMERGWQALSERFDQTQQHMAQLIDLISSLVKRKGGTR